MKISDISIKKITGESLDWSEFEQKKILLVNVASECGLTPQYTELQYLQDTYGDEKFVVIGVPCNDFGGQEPGTETEIQAFCSRVYQANFPLTEKIHVLGENQHPLYAYVTEKTGETVSWNFQKFLINSSGEVEKSLSPQTLPTDQEIINWIQNA